MKTIRTLIIDPSKEFFVATARYLSSVFPLEVVEIAANEHEAVLKIKKSAPDLVLMDLMLPEWENGMKTLQEIKSQAEAPKVVVVTLQDTEENRESARAAGADEFVGFLEAEENLPSLVERLFPGSNRSTMNGFGENFKRT